MKIPIQTGELCDHCVAHLRTLLASRAHQRVKKMITVCVCRETQPELKSLIDDISDWGPVIRFVSQCRCIVILCGSVVECPGEQEVLERVAAFAQWSLDVIRANVDLLPEGNALRKTVEEAEARASAQEAEALRDSIPQAHMNN